MGDSPTIDWTKTIVWQASASAAQLAECQKLALQQQQELLQDSQQRMASWTKRRQQALETGLEALSRMAACKTPVEMATIYGEWMSGSITRVLDDLDEAQAQAVKLTERLQQASKTLFDAQQAAASKVEPTLPVVTAPESWRQAAD
ncbi:MAG TPA: hypothetical protein VFB13_11190 [Reyranella sp.]|nr:hypothetical protein [Reyranella sp.]